MDHAVPSEPGVVDNDVDLATTKFGCALHKLSDVVAVQNIAGHSQCAARLDGIDGVSDRVGLLYFRILVMFPGFKIN